MPKETHSREKIDYLERNTCQDFVVHVRGSLLHVHWGSADEPEIILICQYTSLCALEDYSMFLWLCKDRKMLSTVKRIIHNSSVSFLSVARTSKRCFFDKIYLSNVSFAFEWDTNSGLLLCLPHKAKHCYSAVL